MPGLIRGIARTAVIAGTATAVSNGVSRRQQGRWADQQQQQVEHEAYEQQQQAAAYQQPPPPAYAQPVYAPPPAAAPPPAVEMDGKIAQLQKLGELKQQGILTEAEFQAEKAKLLQG